jgi:hypothetical protein
VNWVSVWVTLLKSRKKTLATLNSRDSARPRTAMIRKASNTASRPIGSGVHPSTPQATARITTIGAVCHSATSIVLTGNSSLGIGSLMISPRLLTSERVPPLKVSVKKWTITMPEIRWMAKGWTSSPPRPMRIWNTK